MVGQYASMKCRLAIPASEIFQTNQQELAIETFQPVKRVY